MMYQTQVTRDFSLTWHMVWVAMRMDTPLGIPHNQVHRMDIRRRLVDIPHHLVHTPQLLVHILPRRTHTHHKLLMDTLLLDTHHQDIHLLDTHLPVIMVIIMVHRLRHTDTDLAWAVAAWEC